MVLIGEVEPIVSDPRDEFADADIISSGDDNDLTLRGFELTARIVRSRRAKIIAIPVLAAALAAGAVLTTDSRPASEPAPPSQQITITNSAVGGAGVVGHDGWVGAAGCRRGRGCPRGLAWRGRGCPSSWLGVEDLADALDDGVLAAPREVDPAVGALPDVVALDH
jgi:hypothetical protein